MRAFFIFIIVGVCAIVVFANDLFAQSVWYPDRANFQLNALKAVLLADPISSDTFYLLAGHISDAVKVESVAYPMNGPAGNKTVVYPPNFVAGDDSNEATCGRGYMYCVFSRPSLPSNSVFGIAYRIRIEFMPGHFSC